MIEANYEDAYIIRLYSAITYKKNETSMPKKKLVGLASKLVAKNIIDGKTLHVLLDEVQNDQQKLQQKLIKRGLASSSLLAQLNAEEFGLPVFDLSVFDSDSAPRDLISDELMYKHQLAPLVKKDSKLLVAVIDPANHEGINAIKFNTNLTVQPIVVEEAKIMTLIDLLNEGREVVIDSFEDNEDLEEMSIDFVNIDNEENNETNEEDGPIVKFVHKMLISAIQGKSSDLHFEPYEKMYRVRFRTDGILHEVTKPPVNLATRLVSRLKIMAGMDISERRKPQDGRIKIKISKNKSIDFRVNTLPTLWGEKVVLRILDASSAKMGIDALGYEESQKEMYLNALNQPQGMILVTGPTGSGKTVSLYTGLNILNTPNVNISTAEDPVEINLEGINQVNVNPKQGLNFSDALKAFLRQDPDIIMVGEIRDLETANIAIKASQTGHLVLSTLHTNSAADTLTRLQNMGVPSFNIATSVSLIIAQRLARRLCPICKKTVRIPKETLLKEGFTDEQSQSFLYSAVGCVKCNKGYQGRVGIYEVMRITTEIQEIILAEGSSLEIEKVAIKQGFNNLRQSGLMKVIEGVTSLEEVNRVTLD